MAFKAFMSPISGWLAEWQYWRGQNGAPSLGERLRRFDVLIAEVTTWQAELSSANWVDPHYLKEMIKVAQYCVADDADKLGSELREIASLDFGEPEGLAKFFKTPDSGVWTPPDNPEYRRMQTEFDARIAAEAKRFERILRTARGKIIGVEALQQAPPSPVFASRLTEAASSPRRASQSCNDAESATPISSRITSSEFRAQLVAQVIRELNVLGPQLFVPSDYARLKTEKPDYLTFQVTEANGDLRTRLHSFQAHRQHILLAQQIVACYAGRAVETIKIDWRMHKPLEFRQKSRALEPKRLKTPKS